MPVSLTMRAERLPPERRARAGTLTVTGYHTGAVTTSLPALRLTGDWQVLFYVLGAAGLAVAAVQWFRLPESAAFLRAGIGVCVASFMGLLPVYGLNTWPPKLMNDPGIPCRRP